MLSSCSNNIETCTFLFLSKEERYIVIPIASIILPKYDLYKVLNVNISQFIDMVHNDIETELNKTIFKKGPKPFIKKTIQSKDKPISNINKENFYLIFSFDFDLSKKHKKVINQQKLNIKSVSEKETDIYHIYKFLPAVLYYTILGFTHLKKTGEEVLAYDPVQRDYNGCIFERNHKRKSFAFIN